MPDLCDVDDVSAILGYQVPEADVPRVELLIGMASDVVGGAVALPEGDVPRAVAYVTASLVVRTMANPGAALTSEAIGTYKVGYAVGMALSETDRAVLAPWLLPAYAAYSVYIPLGSVNPCVPPPFDWELDLDPESIDR